MKKNILRNPFTSKQKYLQKKLNEKFQSLNPLYLWTLLIIIKIKVVIVDPDGNELSLEDALKFGYIDEKMAEELRAQEQDEEDAQ